MGALIRAHRPKHNTRSGQTLSEGASPLTVGVLMSLFSALPMLLGVTAGRMVDRVDIRRPILACVVTLAVAVLVPGIVPRLPVLFAAPGGVAAARRQRRRGGAKFV